MTLLQQQRRFTFLLGLQRPQTLKQEHKQQHEQRRQQIESQSQLQPDHQREESKPHPSALVPASSSAFVEGKLKVSHLSLSFGESPLFDVNLVPLIFSFAGLIAGNSRHATLLHTHAHARPHSAAAARPTKRNGFEAKTAAAVAASESAAEGEAEAGERPESDSDSDSDDGDGGVPRESSHSHRDSSPLAGFAAEFALDDATIDFVEESKPDEDDD